MSLLFVGPAGDAAERTLEEVGRQVVLAVPSGTPLTELWGKTSGLSRQLIDQELTGAPHCLYFGHGDDDGLGDPLLVDDVNVGQLKGSIILALACCPPGPSVTMRSPGTGCSPTWASPGRSSSRCRRAAGC